MTPISRRSLLAGCGCCTGLALAGCTTTGGDATAPGYKPALATDEGGLWQIMDKTEAELKRSRGLVRDEGLTRYIRDIVCRMAADHCPDVRVYVVRTPVFNASMAPNGMMQVYSGLLLRTRNEAQLAAVLGHEMGHFLRKHALNRWRDARAKADFAAFLGLGLALAGAPLAGGVAQMALVASAFSYNRDQEREADDIGITLMAKAGYAPGEAARVWEQLIAEKKAMAEEAERNLFFASHPEPEERQQTLSAKAKTLVQPGQTDGAQPYRAQLRGLRRTLFEDELRLRQFPRTLVLLDRLSADVPPDADVMHFYGETYRLRAENGDLERARGWYERSVAQQDAPPEAWRGLGLVLRQQREGARASDALQRYLALARNATDRELIQSYITMGS
ncbi:M48 family metallopeptidase [Azospirillum soli]|uniref:M48 family metallopeptidase n=1 Tax=Azospirillum soli TaxID=1304799 RepID=UPI001AEA0954|nr:M48 family metallopeptidase [Azospirillum soli]MBP2313775.1 putative Zn-dependent protease [Azospirillum soli]